MWLCTSFVCLSVCDLCYKSIPVVKGELLVIVIVVVIVVVVVKTAAAISVVTVVVFSTTPELGGTVMAASLYLIRSSSNRWKRLESPAFWSFCKGGRLRDRRSASSLHLLFCRYR